MFVAHRVDPAVAALNHRLAGPSLTHQAGPPSPHVEQGVLTERNRPFRCVYQLQHRHQRPDHFGGNSEHLEKAAVDDHNLEFVVEHAKALRHALQRGLEEFAFFAQSPIDNRPGHTQRKHERCHPGNAERQHVRRGG